MPFQNHGYQGLYGGLDRNAIYTKKGLKKSHQILDYMWSTEFIANLFQATQTDEKLRKDKFRNHKPLTYTCKWGAIFLKS